MIYNKRKQKGHDFMIKIPWNTLPTRSKSKTITAEVGDIRIILTERPADWNLSFGIRVYTKDRTKSMIRPHIGITNFDKPCTVDEAKALTEQYLEYFLSTINSAIEIVD